MTYQSYAPATDPMVPTNITTKKLSVPFATRYPAKGMIGLRG